MSMEIAKGYAGTAAYSSKSSETRRSESSQSAERSDKNAEYLSKLDSMFPSLKLEAGSGVTMENDHKISFRIDPALLEKMQNDPEAEKHATELLEGAVQARKLIAAIHKATGVEYEFAHDYIDENGRYWHGAVSKRKDETNEMLRKKNWEDAEKRISDSIEKAREKRKELREKLEKASDKNPKNESRTVMFSANSKSEIAEKTAESYDRGKSGASVDIRI